MRKSNLINSFYDSILLKRWKFALFHVQVRCDGETNDVELHQSHTLDALGLGL